jgi:hypothetical protein
MKYFFTLSVIILIINSIDSFKPADFCKKDSQKISKNCIAHNCGTKFCTLNKKTCDSFFTLGIFLKKWSKQPKAYATFIENIKNCEIKDYKNQ